MQKQTNAELADEGEYKLIKTKGERRYPLASDYFHPNYCLLSTNNYIFALF